jgi:hypothetical protein
MFPSGGHRFLGLGTLLVVESNGIHQNRPLGAWAVGVFCAWCGFSSILEKTGSLIRLNLKTEES